ncbi:MAG: hypothetical protein RL369_1737 [Pseudomonadota bacterium]
MPEHLWGLNANKVMFLARGGLHILGRRLNRFGTQNKASINAVATRYSMQV